MEKVTPFNIGAVVNDFFKNTFAYSFTSLSEHAPEFLREIFNWVQIKMYPFIMSNSIFVMLGVAGFTLMSSSMYVSNVVIDARKELFQLAADSKINTEPNIGFRKMIPKKFENIFVFTDGRLDKKNLHNKFDKLFEECNLIEPHFDLQNLIQSIKGLYYSISFHDYSEIYLKELLIDYGWNFNLVNQAFMVIDMELCNTIAGAYSNVSQFELAQAMKSVKEIAVNGYTQKKIEEHLLENGTKKKHLDKIFKSIYKVQKLHTRLKKVQERRIKKALRLNMMHPSKVTNGEFNS